MKRAPIALVILMAASVPGALAAQSQQPAGDAAGTAAGDVPSEEDGEIVVEGEIPKEKRRVCEMQTSTGSIMPKRVCRTVAQIEDDAKTARDSLEILRRDHDTRSFVELSRGQGQ